MNDTVFWDTAYRDNAPALLGVLRRYVRETSVAQDLLHEVFITAINKRDSYANKGSFEGWLHRIAVNTALMHLRNEKNKQVPAEAVLTLADDDDADENQSDNARVAIEAAGFSDGELLAAIDRLPEHHKLVFNMYVMDDFSHKQIGAELNISPGTSKSHLARARKRIQQFLYDDALNKKKIKDKRWASAVMLFFPAKTHYIDKLYQEGLSNFKLPPPGGTEFMSAALEQQASSVVSSASQVASSTASTATHTVASTAVQSSASVATQVVSTVAFWGSKLSYVAMCCGTAAITGTVCWLSMGDNSPLNTDKDAAIPVADPAAYSSKPAVTDSTYDATDNFASITEVPGESIQESQSNESISPTGNHTNPQQTGDEVSKPGDIASHQEKEDNQPLTTGKGLPQATTNTSSTGGGANIPRSKAKAQAGSKVDTMLRATHGANQADAGLPPKPEPLVIKKQIIQRQTVVVRDTIIITE